MAEKELQGFCKTAEWDVEEGRRLFEAGVRYAEIAERLGTTVPAVSAYARRHWRKRETEKKQQTEQSAKKQAGRSKRLSINPATGLPMMGPCTEECEGCEYIFRSGGLPICEYYLRTGEHRYPKEDGSCAVKRETDGEKYVYVQRLERARKQRQEMRDRWRNDPAYAESMKRKPAWDTEKGLELWLKGDTYRQIADAVGAKEGAVKNAACKHWRHLRAERDAAVEARGGVLGEARVGNKPGAYGVSWDLETAQRMWLQGKSYKDIGIAVGTSTSNVKNYANRKWAQLRAQRDAAVIAAGGVKKKHR